MGVISNRGCYSPIDFATDFRLYIQFCGDFGKYCQNDDGGESRNDSIGLEGGQIIVRY